MKQYKHILSIEVEDEGILAYGQRVYVIQQGRSERINEKCPVCNDERKIVLKGFQFDCPNCTGYGRRQGATGISLYDYEVCEYIIHKVEIKGDTVKSKYNKDGSPANGNFPVAVYSGFHRTGNGSYAVEFKSFCQSEFKVPKPEEVIRANGRTSICFFKEKDAKDYAKKLHQLQKDEVLGAFNKDHGTSHDYPFKY